jgi:exonuclease III
MTYLTMKLLTWNIRHGGGARLPRIVEELAAYDADVIALTEYRTGPGKELRRALLERGWPNVETTDPPESENGIAVFSRTSLLRTRVCPVAPEHRVRWLDIDLPEYGFGVCVLHIMAAGSSKTHPLNAEQFGNLSALGWTDVWRHHNPGATEWTWYSTLKGGARGNGFRLDHCFATPSLLPRLTSCRYSHAERDAGISDHSIAIVEVKNRQARALRMAGRR